MLRVDARDVHVRLAGREVIAGANFQVSAGEFVGLLGPNGAGKTTLMRAILGLVPSTGNITTNGYAGYVPQRHEVEWGFPVSVEKAVLGGRTGLIGWLRRPKAADRQAAARAVEQVGLQHLARRPIGELSGGQRQRMLIARALATEPAVLFLDEPFTGLDAPNADILLELFTELAAQGTAIVMSTHNLAEAVHTCPRLVLFNGGVVADGPREEILADAAPWVKAFGVAETSPLLAALGIDEVAA